jgi:arylformamidase
MTIRKILLAWIALFFVCASTVLADETEISYGKAEQQKLDVYSAIGSPQGKACPVVVWVHGGGWRLGDKDNRSGINLCKSWANAGIVMVNLNYRLTPDVMHPAHVQDVAAGIAWVQKNIAKHGGDPEKIYLLGHSAGAHLVALVATNPEYLKAHRLVPKTTLAGVMSIDTASYDLASTRTLAVRKMIRDAFGDVQDTLTSASPIQQAKANSDTCPPFILAVVKQRPEAWRESIAFKDALLKSKLIVMSYPESGQLKAHAKIALDLLDTNNEMTRQLLDFVTKGKW